MCEEKGGIFPWKTAAQDPRFPNANQTRYCYTMFVDFHRCSRLLGSGNKKCEYFQKAYKSICPNEWVAKWEKQLETNTFPVDLPEVPPKQ